METIEFAPETKQQALDYIGLIEESGLFRIRELKQKLDLLDATTLLCIGDIMADKYTDLNEAVDFKTVTQKQDYSPAKLKTLVARLLSLNALFLSASGVKLNQKPTDNETI